MGLRQLCLKLRAAQFPLAESLIIRDYVRYQYDRYVGPCNVVDHVLEKEGLKQIPSEPERVHTGAPYGSIALDPSIPNRIGQSRQDDMRHGKNEGSPEIK